MVQTTVRYTLLYLLVIVTAVSASLVSVNAYYVQRDLIFPGVKVAGIPLEGYTQAQAAQLLKARLGPYSEAGAVLGTVYFDNQEWPLAATDIKFSIDAAATARQAYAQGRSGHGLLQLWERYKLRQAGTPLPLTLTYDELLFQQFVDGLCAAVYQQAEDAQIQREGMQFIVQPEQMGHHVDRARLTVALQQEIGGGVLPFRQQLPVIMVTPGILASDLAHINTVLARYATEYDDKQVYRSHNILLATEQLHNTLVKNGAHFSFNQRIGPRTKERGYQEAPVMIDGQIVPDVGGGVCQVTSTLYNAVLLAGLTPVERTAHFRPPVYVPLGLDATVADGLLDFTFPNTLSDNILIQATAQGSQLTVTILGKNQPERPELHLKNTVLKVVESAVIVKQDPQLPLGVEVQEKTGSQGFQIMVERIGALNGVETYRETVSVDEYQPEDRVLRIGTKISSPEDKK